MDKKTNFFKQVGFDIVKIWIEVVMLSLILCTITAIATTAPSCYIWVAMCLVFGALGVLLAYLLPGLRLLQTILGALICIGSALGLHFALDSNIPLSIFMGICFIAIDLRGRALTEKEWDEASPSFLYTIFVVFTLIFTLAVGIIPMLEPFRPIATLLGPIIVIVGLLTMNSLNVRSLTDVQRNSTSAGAMAVSKNMNLQNKLLLLVVLAVVILLSLLGPIYNGLYSLLRMFFAWLTSREASEPEGPLDEGGGGMEQPDMSGLAVPHERNPLWVKIEEIFIIVVAVITLIAIVCFLAWAAWKGIRKLIAYLKTVDWFATREGTDLEEYEDTRESLVDIRDLPKEYLRRMGDWLSDRLKREPSWADLKTNAEKARALYRRTLLKARAGGYKENAAYTPSQTLKAVIPHVKVSPQSLDTLRDCYEQARYGEREPDGEAVEALNREI
ncbi:MAG: DUF4129 domain-containing protein [Ruminococcaceae bacterium]|nr:DUF4129 domain-containing protein [Oscillospiraceae bacterium]